MHRLFPAAAALVALSSPVHAAESFSFMIGGHQVLIAAPPHCGYGPCVSISPGTPHRRARPDDGDRQLVTSSVTPAAAAPAASKPASPPALCMAPAVPLRPAPPQAQQVAPPPPVQRPQIQSVQAIPLPPPITTAAITPPPPPIPQSPAPIPPASPPQEIVPPLEVAPQVFNDAPRIAKVSHQVEEEPADTPLGDWHAEGQKGLVRIEPCGRSLCGYIVDAAANAKGETILVDMKSKSASKWSGNIYSRDSGNTYYGTITMKGPDLLKVEACALGHFFCSGTL